MKNIKFKNKSKNQKRKTLIKSHKNSNKKFKNRKFKNKKFKSFIKNIKRKYLYIFLISLLFFIIILIFYIFLFRIKIIDHTNIILNENIKHYKVNETIDEKEYEQIIHEFIYINFNGTLINNYKKFKKIKNPKISVIISVYNGEYYIKKAVRSVQNQDFTDIEIIIVDDKSKDGSVKIIKELLNEDPRITLLQNNENKGTFYTRLRGILEAKGKYTLILDVDDLYGVENAFSIIYEEIEKNNLDMLGFASFEGDIDMNNNKFNFKSYHDYFETPIITQPELSERHMIKKGGKIIDVRDSVCNYLYKTELLVRVANEIDDKFKFGMKTSFEDMFLFFIIARRAKSLKHIKKLIYIAIQGKISNNPLIAYYTEEKYKKRSISICLSLILYVEFVLLKTNDNFNDKKLPNYAIQTYLLNNDCKYKERKEAIEACKLYLENQYIENSVKERIKSFLSEVNNK